MINKKSTIITDSSIWIDIIKSNLLKDFFLMPYSICTPDFLKGYESVNVGWEDLEENGLHFINLSGDEIAELYMVSRSQKSLSLADLASVFVAKKTCGILLTGDKRLRTYAEQSVEVHGLLWLMDQMINEQIIFPLIAIQKLERLMLDPKVRLPKTECEQYLKKWREIIF